MFISLTSSDFVRAIASTEARGFFVDKNLALSIINRMYELKGKSQFGPFFKKYRNIALAEHGITDLLRWGAYKNVTVSYFQTRAVRAKKKTARNKSIAEEMPVSNMSDVSVRIQIYAELHITFAVILSARGKVGNLTWDDIDNGAKEVLSGSKSITKNHWIKAKKKAFAIIKERRLKKARGAA